MFSSQIDLFDVVYSEIRAIRISEYVVWIEFLRRLQCRDFKLFSFEGAHQHAHIAHHRVRASKMQFSMSECLLELLAPILAVCIEWL